MRLKLLFGIAAILLFASQGTVHAADAKKNPTVVGQIQPIDKLLANTAYAMRLLEAPAEQTAQFKMVLDQAKAAINAGDGLFGIDVKRSIGIHAQISEDFLDSSVVALIPLKNEKALLAFLNNTPFAPEEGQDGIYTIANTPGFDAGPVYFRSANGYLYVTIKKKDAIADVKNLPPREKVLDPNDNSLLKVSLDLDGLPQDWKAKALAALDQGIPLPEAKPGETELERKVAEYTTKSMIELARSLINDSRSVFLSMTIDEQSEDFGFELGYTARPGSKLARDIAALGSKASPFGRFLGSEKPVMTMAGTVPIPKQFAALIAESVNNELKKEGKSKDEIAVYSALWSAFPVDQFEGGFTLVKKGKDNINGIFGMKIEDGKKIDELLRKSVAELPAKEKEKIKLDVASVAGIKIHHMYLPEDNENKAAKELFGANPEAHFACQEKALWLVVGKESLDILKSQLVLKEAKQLPLFVMEAGVAALNQFDSFGGDSPNKEAEKRAAKALWGDDAKGTDRMTLVIEGGASLRLRMSMHSKLLTFFARVAKEQQDIE